MELRLIRLKADGWSNHAKSLGALQGAVNLIARRIEREQGLLVLSKNIHGSLVGIVSSIRMVGIYSPIIWPHVLAGALSGIVCGVVVLWALRRAKLFLREPSGRQVA